MPRLVRLLGCSLPVIALALTCSCGTEGDEAAIAKKEAAALISSYVGTLKSGDIDAIKRYWSTASVNRKGFDVMHLWVGGLIHISEWKAFLDSTQYAYQVKELLDKDGYYIIDGEWTRADSGPAGAELHPMPFYLVWEDSSWLLVNPIDVLTRDWGRYETGGVVFVYPEETDIENHVQEMLSLDERYQSMCKAMDFSPGKKIEYYKASSPEECGRLLTQGAFNGLAAVTYADSIEWFKIAVSTTFYNPHEVMHIVALSSGVPYSNSLLSEGLAVAYGGTTFQTAEFAHNYSRIMMDGPGYIPVKRLLAMTGPEFLRSSYVTYQEAGSFIRYLVDAYGMARLRSLVSGLSGSTDLDAQAVKSYGVSLNDLEKEWRQYLSKMELPKLGFSMPGEAEPVLSLTDPRNDDKGDGDYECPSNEGYLKGCFDLTSFEVSKDEDRVYFRIGLQKVIEPVMNRPGGARFVPAVVIAINKGDGAKRQLCRYTNEVQLQQGYDLKINVGFGINISDSLGKIYVATGDSYGEMADLKSNTLAFSLPMELIGEPEDDWKYFVGVGLASQPAFDFSGLVPVFRDTPGLVSGGNYDYSNPGFMDILLPASIDQARMLSDYDSERGRFASLKMVSSTGETF
jgi:hypothetical protein